MLNLNCLVVLSFIETTQYENCVLANISFGVSQLTSILGQKLQDLVLGQKLVGAQEFDDHLLKTSTFVQIPTNICFIRLFHKNINRHR